MGFYSVYKIIKDIFRTVFGNKSLRLIFILLISIFIGFILFSNNSNAVTTSDFTFKSDYFTQNDVNNALSIANNYYNNNLSNVDIFLLYSVAYNEKQVVFFDYHDLSDDVYYGYVNSSDGQNQSGHYWYFGYLYLLGNNTSSYVNKSFFKLTGVQQGNTSRLTPDTAHYNRIWVCTAPRYDIGSTELYVLPVRTHFDIYEFNSGNKGDLISDATVVKPPYFVTTNEELQTYDFDYLQINGGTVPYYTEISDGIGGNADLILQYNYKGVTTNIDLTDFITVTDNKFSVNVPYNYLTNYTIVRNEQEFSYVFKYRPFYR